MVNLIEFDPGATVPAHSHPHEQLGIVLRGMQALVVDGVAHELGPMEGYVLPGHVEHSAYCGPEGATVIDIFAPCARTTGSAGPAKPQIHRHNEGVSQTIEAPVEVRLPDEDNEHDHDRPWIVIVWNDPINLMSYVTFVLRKLFGFSEEEATKLMLQVHNDGKAVVSSGEKEKAEFDVARLHAHGSVGNAQAGLMAKRSIKRDRKGGYTLHLPPDERELLRSLPAQFREVLQTDDPGLRRLFPPAYTDDDDANDEFQRLMREELLEGKLAALEIVERDGRRRAPHRRAARGLARRAREPAPLPRHAARRQRGDVRRRARPRRPERTGARAVRLPELAAGAGGRGAVGRRSSGTSSLRLDEHAPRRQLEARLHRIVDRVEREDLPEQRRQLEPAGGDVLEQDRQRDGGILGAVHRPVRNFSRRRNSPGSRSSRSPVGGSPTITVVPPLRVKRNAVALVSGKPTASKP